MGTITNMNVEKKILLKGLLKSDELYEYVLETNVYPREPKPMQELRTITDNLSDAFLATTPDTAQLLRMLVKQANAKKTIEIGVYTGYSLLATALSIPGDGKIIAIDPSRSSYEIGLPVIKKSGVEHKINFHESEALPILNDLLNNPENEGSFDFAYVDADKNNYPAYHEKLLKLLKPGGIIVYDNTLWGGTVAIPDEKNISHRRKEMKRHIIEFNKILASDTRIDIAQVPVGDGMTICRIPNDF